MSHQASQPALPPVAPDSENQHILPSPSPSDSRRKEEPEQEELEPPSPCSNSPNQQPPVLKRGRDDEPEVGEEVGEGSQRSQKRIRLDAPESAPIATAKAEEPYNPIAHWVIEGVWPDNFHEKGIQMSEPIAKKRSLPQSVSYSQSVKDGTNPKPYTPAYQQLLTSANIFMDVNASPPSITAESRRLCDDYLDGNYDLPANPLYHDVEFGKLLARLSDRNEARVVRDLTPMIMPSVEHLHILGDEALSDLTEELNTEWIKCNTLAGPRPKPDCAAGLKPSAFTEEELMKLKVYTAPARATLFTENMYFPFLMCEAKSGDTALARADRQNMHSCSVAVNALVQLFRAVPAVAEQDGETGSRVQELNRQVLAFSIAHDHSSARLYGHYPVIEGDKTSFYRFPIYQLNFAFGRRNDRWNFYQFVRSVYAEFAPVHTRRIQSAVAQLPPPPESPPEEGDGVQQGDVVPTSQDDSAFKKPALPISVRQQKEIDHLQQVTDALLREKDDMRRQENELRRREDSLRREKDEETQKLRREKDEEKQMFQRIIKLLEDQVAAKTQT
ncbi:MAG: hypothetical protein LQ344_004259 [Seirophora lacunosa]|nr:MAG: hypothetical protein LQ344_004259 [Seirophora lacunosa]